jgi:hypothetical protein
MPLKKLVFFAIFFLLIQVVYAQEKTDRIIRFGLRAAPSLAWLKPESPTVLSKGLSPRFLYGVVFDYRFADYFWFGTGADITYLGGAFSYKSPSEINHKAFPDLDAGYSVITESKYFAQFLELPLTVKMKTNEINYMVYYAQVGLNPGIRLDAKALHAINGPKQSKVKSISDINPLRLAINISGGVEYNLTQTTSLLVGVTYNNGFTNLFKKTSPYVRNSNTLKSTELILRSNYIALNVGFLF